jgi:hypothetical protein
VTLRSLSDKEILSRIHDLTSRERKLTLAVLLHLNEIERRKLHLKHGYASMFDYCTSGLGYSASAAGRRIQTSRCIARFPEIRELLESNRVNLTTVSLVSRIRGESDRRRIRTARGNSARSGSSHCGEDCGCARGQFVRSTGWCHGGGSGDAGRQTLARSPM